MISDQGGDNGRREWVNQFLVVADIICEEPLIFFFFFFSWFATVSSVFFLLSKHWPSGPMLSISLNVRVSVRVSVCSLLRNRLNVFLPPLPEIGCPILIEIRNPWGKVMKRSGLRFEHFFWKWGKHFATYTHFCIPFWISW